jgi:hypothetical protein
LEGRGSLARYFLFPNDNNPGSSGADMDNIARRTFCGTALMALPLLKLNAKDNDIQNNNSSLIIDNLADEISRITFDGAQHGFNGEHFRRYAGVMRTFDTVLEDKGINRELDKELDDDDYYKLDLRRASEATLNYWNKHGIAFDQGNLASLMAIDAAKYREIKKAIKRQGGVRAIHRSAAEAFERKAQEHGDALLKLRLPLHDERVVFPGVKEPEFVLAQFGYGVNEDCLCKALLTEGYILVVLGFFFGAVLSAIGSLEIAIANLLIMFGACNVGNC